MKFEPSNYHLHASQ